MYRVRQVLCPCKQSFPSPEGLRNRVTQAFLSSLRQHVHPGKQPKQTCPKIVQGETPCRREVAGEPPGEEAIGGLLLFRGGTDESNFHLSPL